MHIDTISLLHERKVAAFFPDGDGETVPSNLEGMAYPIHALQIASMGMACCDSLQFEELVKVCEEEKCWEFLVVTAPLRLPDGTGFLFNPIAMFWVHSHGGSKLRSMALGGDHSPQERRLFIQFCKSRTG